MENPSANSQLPIVSVVIPARNEEASLGTCLQSLVTQTGTFFEIIVVDDNSTDRTREIAEGFFGVQVIQAPPLPEGWVGKNHAVSIGAARARGEWLLLTDADTVHLPGSLARTVAEARQREVELLSYSPFQVTKTFWEKALQPVVFAELAAAYKLRQVSNPNSPAAAANGQYFFIRRSVYESVGGHAAIPDSMLEDVMLARLVKASGYKIYFRYGGDAVQTRMYRNLAELRAGWTKNLALLFPSPRFLAALSIGEFLLIPGLLIAAVVTEANAHPMIAMNLGILAVLFYGNFFARILRAHCSEAANFSAFFGLPLFAFLLLKSKKQHKRGITSWKGRNYAAQRGKSSASVAEENRNGHKQSGVRQHSPSRLL